MKPETKRLLQDIRTSNLSVGLKRKLGRLTRMASADAPLREYSIVTVEYEYEEFFKDVIGHFGRYYDGVSIKGLDSSGGRFVLSEDGYDYDIQFKMTPVGNDAHKLSMEMMVDGESYSYADKARNEDIYEGFFEDIISQMRADAGHI